MGNFYRHLAIFYWSHCTGLKKHRMWISLFDNVTLDQQTRPVCCSRQNDSTFWPTAKNEKNPLKEKSTNLNLIKTSLIYVWFVLNLSDHSCSKVVFKEQIWLNETIFYWKHKTRGKTWTNYKACTECCGAKFFLLFRLRFILGQLGLSRILIKVWEKMKILHFLICEHLLGNRVIDWVMLLWADVMDKMFS